MRLSTFEQSAIASAARAVLPPGSSVKLFGSRTDDSRRGGDIDLLVEPPDQLDAGAEVELRTRFAARMYREMGERRIDILVVPANAQDDRLIVAEARRQAIELLRT
jgi:predicted nucleotidyltransferase